jgi:hypothetical protein
MQCSVRFPPRSRTYETQLLTLLASIGWQLRLHQCLLDSERCSGSENPQKFCFPFDTELNRYAENIGVIETEQGINLE